MRDSSWSCTAAEVARRSSAQAYRRSRALRELYLAPLATEHVRHGRSPPSHSSILKLHLRAMPNSASVKAILWITAWVYLNCGLV